MKSNPNELKKMVSLVMEELEIYLTNSQAGEGKALNQEKPEHIARELELEKKIRQGAIDEKNVRAFVKKYLSFTQHMHHPGYIGHQVAVPHLASGIADMIHGFVNNPMAIYEMGPSAATIEKVVVNWMLDKIGWFKGDHLHESSDERIVGGGVLTHGGSLANLTALLAARAKADPDVWKEGYTKPMYVLVPETAHYSIARAISIMGMGSDNVIPIDVNEHEQMKPDSLQKRLDSLQKEGKMILAVVANACATSTGLYDPIDEIGDICNKQGVWFHIDGAHGAGALLSEDHKHLMKGVTQADSMIWDAHKMLRTSALSAAVLFKDHRDLDGAFRQKGDYIIFDKEKIGYDFMFNTVECTKSGLGTKVFWTLAAEGEKGVADYITDRYNKTKSFYELINGEEDFECPYIPESNILCFRYSGGDQSDSFQLSLRNELTKDGKFYITTTTIRGKRYLRLTVMNPLTDQNHILGLLKEIRVVAGRIEQG